MIFARRFIVVAFANSSIRYSTRATSPFDHRQIELLLIAQKMLVYRRLVKMSISVAFLWITYPSESRINRIQKFYRFFPVIGCGKQYLECGGNRRFGCYAQVIARNAGTARLSSPIQGSAAIKNAKFNISGAFACTWRRRSISLRRRSQSSARRLISDSTRLMAISISSRSLIKDIC